MGKFREFLLRNAGGENESGRAVYILRVAALGETIYFALFGLFLLIFGVLLPSILPFSCCAAALLILWDTYRRHSPLSLTFFYILNTLWIIVAVVFFGWDAGIQHMTFVLLLFIFITSYLSMSIKVVLGLLVYALRMGLYFYTLSAEPVFPFSIQLNHVIQFLDTTTVYLLLILIMSVFATDTLRAEGKLAKANRKLNTLADTDPLTKLPNRRCALRHIEECVMESPTPICPTVAIGDIDFFKKVNDTYGHEAGDKVLEVLADLVKETMEPHGFCARWGGEEFLFFFESLNIDNASFVLNVLLDKIRATVISFQDLKINVTMTFGMEDTILNGKTSEEISRQVDQVIGIADQKLYMGKQNGRNQVVA